MQKLESSSCGTGTSFKTEMEKLNNNWIKIENSMSSLEGKSGSALTVIDSITGRYERERLPRIENNSATGRASLYIYRFITSVGPSYFLKDSADVMNLNVPVSWDDAQFAMPDKRAGKDFSIFATPDGVIFSANAILPAGYTPITARKIGGFHCLCLSVGEITDHPLSGFMTGDIIPSTIWDLNHLPVCLPYGMFYCEPLDIWVDIYMQSGVGNSTSSVYGATATVNRNWVDFNDDLAAVRKRMLTDAEFSITAAGSNEMTNIQGSTSPGTTGGHMDTVGRRMISNFGGEDMTGVWWQCLNEGSYRVTEKDGKVDTGFSWFPIPGDKGAFYHQGSMGDIKLLAGGVWSYATYCGSQARAAAYTRLSALPYLGGRGCASAKK